MVLLTDRVLSWFRGTGGSDVMPAAALFFCGFVLLGRILLGLCGFLRIRVI